MNNKSYYSNTSSKLNESCKIMYSYPKIINGTISVAFYNPSESNMTGIKVIVPKSNGVDIYNVNKPLLSNKTEVLTFFKYTGPIENVNKFTIVWCCDDICYKSKLNRYSNSIKINVKNYTINYTAPSNQSKFSEGNESYPPHPKISDCNKLNNTIVRQFCFSDVAEINNNLSICNKFVDDHDISPFCVARVTLNEKLCDNISDSKLRQSCRESIEMKKSWLNEK